MVLEREVVINSNRLSSNKPLDTIQKMTLSLEVYSQALEKLQEQAVITKKNRKKKRKRN